MKLIRYQFLTRQEIKQLKAFGFIVEFHKTCQIGYGYKKMYAIGVKEN